MLQEKEKAKGLLFIYTMFCLTVPTDPAWAPLAVASMDLFLKDHAHCEMKAASNALSLVSRYPEDMPLVMALTELAKEEMLHFEQVLHFLKRRGLSLGSPEVDPYAAYLRHEASSFSKRHLEKFVLVDRLLVGAVIEARSCERFKLLLAELSRVKNDSRDDELIAFYTELFECEAKHFAVYVELAKLAAGEHRHEVDQRLRVLAAFEGEYIRRLSTNSEHHSQQEGGALGDRAFGSKRTTVHG